MQFVNGATMIIIIIIILNSLTKSYITASIS